MKYLLMIIFLLFLLAFHTACSESVPQLIPPPADTNKEFYQNTDQEYAVELDDNPLAVTQKTEDEAATDIIFDNDSLPEGFSYIKTLNPHIKVDLRYAGADNFTGCVVDGYYENQAAILRDAAAVALSSAQEYLEKEGLGLKIHDAYRPQKASDFFVKWAENDDENMKEAFYPHLDKKTLHSSGYIAKKSAHSRGATVDLTLIYFPSGEELDMGGIIDLLDEVSWHDSNLITYEQSQNRNKLRTVMLQFGFTPYAKEWWHYTYNKEKYSLEYFDFDVK
ncbi:MAG: M15 family metallopeptidase [Firmicutes bacterium]|nr:M15 family metallopeptidase [Bacillota bacterium]